MSVPQGSQRPRMGVMADAARVRRGEAGGDGRAAVKIAIEIKPQCRGPRRCVGGDGSQFPAAVRGTNGSTHTPDLVKVAVRGQLKPLVPGRLASSRGAE